MDSSQRTELIVRNAAKLTKDERISLARRLIEQPETIPQVQAERRFSFLLPIAEEVVGKKMERRRNTEDVLIRQFIAYKMRDEGLHVSDIARAMGIHHATVFHYVKQMQTCFDLPVYYARDLEMYHKFEDRINEQVRQPQDRDA